MDFALTPEQRALRDTARAFLDDRFPLDRIAEWGDAGAPDMLAWKEIGELGWLDPDLGVVELVLLAEQTGRALYPGPWLTTVALTGPAYHAAGRTPAGPATLAWAEPAPGPGRIGDPGSTVRVAEGPQGTVRLSGVKTHVPDAGRATELLVTTDSGVYTVDSSDVSLTTKSTVDPTRPLAEVRLVDAPATLLSTVECALPATRLRTLALLAGEAVGVAERALDFAAGHARRRQQFGRFIGANQAVAHRLVDVYADIELARSLAYRAAWCVATSDVDSERAVLTATIAARKAALGAGEAAIQTLGALGFSWEHPVHRWYRRARWIAAFEAPAGDFRARLAGLVLAGVDGTDPVAVPTKDGGRGCE